MINTKEYIDIANDIIFKEVVPILRNRFIGDDISDLGQKEMAMGAIISLARQVLQKHSDAGNINLDGIGVFAAPDVNGRVSVWADNFPKES